MADRKKNQILLAARASFLRYGYKRVSMADIAAAAGLSRPALYLLFKNKEEIFAGVFLHWVEETVAEIDAAMSDATTLAEKLERAFEIWSVRPFELVTALPDAHELVECTFGFAREAQREGYARFEATVAPVLVPLAEGLTVRPAMSAKGLANLLAAAVRGFKQSADSADELRRLVKSLVGLVTATSAHKQP